MPEKEAVDELWGAGELGSWGAGVLGCSTAGGGGKTSGPHVSNQVPCRNPSTKYFQGLGWTGWPWYSDEKGAD